MWAQVLEPQDAPHLARADHMARALGQRLGQRLVRPDVAKRRGRLLAVGPRARQLHKLASNRDRDPRWPSRDRGASSRVSTSGAAAKRAFHLRTPRPEQLSRRAISPVPTPSCARSSIRARCTIACGARCRRTSSFSERRTGRGFSAVAVRVRRPHGQDRRRRQEISGMGSPIEPR